MKNLAIKGHATRGKEVIEILEMLGGMMKGKLGGTETFCAYYVDSDGSIDYKHYSRFDDTIQFTLEEFLEKFPYKIGDKVQRNGTTSCGSVFVIEQMKWEDNQIKYVICDLYWKNCKSTVTSKDLQPYKEETMDKAKAPNLIGEDYCGKRFGYKIPNGYEFDCIKNNEIILKPKQPQYPKTYEECCEILNYIPNLYDADEILVYGYMCDELRILQKLLVCRKAYWQIAGEELGLDKSWEPKWEIDNVKYSILVVENEIRIGNNEEIQRLLVFPTEEMRDAFLDSEEIAQLISGCKEFL